MSTTELSPLCGVDHTARPTWLLRETVEFYRDVLGLDLVHTISARGWGPEDHPDFLHFFFDSGAGSSIAFFYYLGTERPPSEEPDLSVFGNATHTAWRTNDRESLLEWKATLEEHGVAVTPVTRHEVIESIYFLDPNGYPIEIAARVRDLDHTDADDAQATLDAAIETIEASDGGTITIDDVWRTKAARSQDASGHDAVARSDSDRAVLRVLRCDEFRPLVEFAGSQPDVTIEARGDYDVISSPSGLSFDRTSMQMKPAIWYGAGTGGIEGAIVQFDRDTLRVVPASAPESQR